MTITASKFFALDPGRLTPEVEDRFFTDLKTQNSTFKRTGRARLNDVDACCVRNLAAAAARIERVLDIGISSGTSTLDLHDHLRAAGHAPRIIGTDLALDGYIVPALPGLRVLSDPGGHPMQYDLLGRAIRSWERRADYLTGMIAVRRMLARFTRRAVQARLEDGHGAQPVRLLSPRLKGHPAITVEVNDIFARTDRFVRRFDFVRAANILNLGYFSEAELRRALSNIFSYLSGGGAWLLVARSKGSANAATLFRLSPDGRRLLVMDRVGGGSEIERLVLSTPLPLHRVEA